MSGSLLTGVNLIIGVLSSDIAKKIPNINFYDRDSISLSLYSKH